MIFYGCGLETQRTAWFISTCIVWATNFSPRSFFLQFFNLSSSGPWPASQIICCCLKVCVYLYIQPLFLTYSIDDQKYCQSHAHQDYFPSALSVMVTPTWGVTVHFGLQQHTELTSQEAGSGFFPSPLSTRSSGPHMRPEVWAEREASEQQRWHVVSVCVTHWCPLGMSDHDL